MPPWQIRIKKLSSHSMFADWVSILKISVPSRQCHLVIPFVLSSFSSKKLNTPAFSDTFESQLVYPESDVTVCTVPVIPYIWMTLLTTCKGTEFTEMFKLVLEVCLVFIPPFQSIWMPRNARKTKAKKEIKSRFLPFELLQLPLCQVSGYRGQMSSLALKKSHR